MPGIFSISILDIPGLCGCSNNEFEKRDSKMIQGYKQT